MLPELFGAAVAGGVVQALLLIPRSAPTEMARTAYGAAAAAGGVLAAAAASGPLRDFALGFALGGAGTAAAGVVGLIGRSPAPPRSQ